MRFRNLLGIIIHISIFLILFVVGFINAGYEISADQYYMNTINTRAYGTDNGLSQAVVTYYDAQKTYAEREWMLQHQEVYYFESISWCVLFIGLVANFIFGMPYWMLTDDWYITEKEREDDRYC